MKMDYQHVKTSKSVYSHMHIILVPILLISIPEKKLKIKFIYFLLMKLKQGKLILIIY